jgi:preprotein translocase subunit SecF
MSRLGNLGNRLYSGDLSYRIVDRRKRWLGIFGTVLLLAILGLLVRGLSFSVDFTGGATITVPTSTMSVSQATSIAENDGLTAPTVQSESVIGGGREILITTKSLSTDVQNKVTADLAKAVGINVNSVNVSQTGASWGEAVSKQAIEALIVFLILVAAYMAIFFEWQMAIAAIVSLFNVIVITVGVYAWSGLEVSPATVTGFLTILGYALYDAVVVFDKVKENTKLHVKTDKLGYSDAANLAVNQTLVRSLNTSLIATIPVFALLLGGILSEASELQDLALALFVGIAAGTISSILVATPTLVWLKQMDPAVRAHSQRVDKKATRGANRQTPAAVAAGAGQGQSAGAGEPEQELAAARVVVTTGSASAEPRRNPAQRNQPVRNTKKKR